MVFLLLTSFIPLSSVSVADFEQLNVSWVIAIELSNDMINFLKFAPNSVVYKTIGLKKYI